MLTIRKLLPAVALAGALALPAAAAAQGPDTVAQVSAPFTATSLPGVTGYGQTLAWSTYDAATQRYQLMASVNGSVSALPVAQRTQPFDVDAGLGPDGDTWLVYTRCASGGPCDIYAYDMGHGQELQLAGLNSPATEQWPTISGSTVAFARRYSATKTVIYRNTISSTGATSAPSRKVPNLIPAQTCATISGKCVAIANAQLNDLELSGGHIAAISTWNNPTGPQGPPSDAPIGIAQTALVLNTTSGRSGRVIAYETVGLSGQQLLGASFDGGSLGWAFGCAAGCGEGLTPASWRYSIAGKTYEQAPTPAGQQVLSYAALGSNEALELLAGGPTGCGNPPEQPAVTCSLVVTAPLSYAAARAGQLPVKLTASSAS